MTDETDPMPAPMEPVSQPANNSPLWSRSTKIIVTVASLLALVWVAQRFRSLIYLLLIAAILAYLLNPVIDFINKRTHFRRGWVIVLLYGGLATAVIGAFIWVGVVAYEQSINLINQIPEMIELATEQITMVITNPQPIRIWRWEFEPIQLTAFETFPWESITNQLLGMVQPTLSTSGVVVSRFATSTVRTIGNIFFVFILSVYIAYEIPQLGKYLSRLASRPGYSYDVERLSRETTRVWNAYLRGQVILALTIFAVVWVGLTIIGVRNALILAIIAGLLEFVPTVGPVVSAVIAMGVAMLQGENHWGVEGWQLALIVLGFMFLVQQVENNLLVPRIVGRALDLNPILVIIGVIMGASLAGILGAVLAAPVLATLKLLGSYGWRKMFDLPPFPAAEPDIQPPPSLMERGRAFLARRK